MVDVSWKSWVTHISWYSLEWYSYNLWRECWLDKDWWDSPPREYWDRKSWAWYQWKHAQDNKLKLNRSKNNWQMSWWIFLWRISDLRMPSRSLLPRRRLFVRQKAMPSWIFLAEKELSTMHALLERELLWINGNGTPNRVPRRLHMQYSKTYLSESWMSLRFLLPPWYSRRWTLLQWSHG